MKRPFATVGFAYMATSAAAVCLFPEVNFILCITAAITAIAACFIWSEKTRSVLIVLSPVCAAFAVIGCCQQSANALSDKLSEQSCVISGEICEIPRMQYGRWRYIIETDRIDLPGVQQNIRILMTSRNAMEEAKEGDRITCEVQFLQSSDETGYNSTTSLRADGIKARCWCKPYGQYSVTEGGFRLRYIPIRIRRGMISCIRKALPDRASAMLCGMLLGDTGYMDQKTVEDFRSTGIAHLLAVSGFHLTLLTFALAELLRRFGVSTKTSDGIKICFILLFMAVTGFAPSVMRAGIMHILVLFSGLILRDNDSLTFLSLSVMIMCFVNPWAAADIGLQLSVCATLGLLMGAARVNQSLLQLAEKILNRKNTQSEKRKIGKAGKRIIRMAANTLTASLAIFPLTSVYFERLSLISPLTNVLCSYAASVFIVIGIIASAIYCIPFVGWLLSFPFRLVTSVICIYLQTVTGSLSGLPVSAVNTSYSYMPYVFLFAILLTCSAFVMNRRVKSDLFGRRLRRFLLCELSALLFTAMLTQQLFLTGAEIIVFDVSDGGVCVCAKNGTHAVFAEAGGDSYELSVIRQTLRKKGVMKVDAVAVSDDSEARSGNIYRLLGQYSPDYLIAGSDLFVRTKTDARPFDSGVKNDSHGLRLETFTDSSGGRWQRMTCGESIAIICPEKGNFALLPESWRSCDAAITGKEIAGLSLMNVGAVIVTAKEKNASVLCRRLRDNGLQHVYSTSENGDITLSVKDGKLRVQTAQG